MDLFLVGGKHPPEKTEKEEKEYQERNDWPDGYIVDTLKNVLVHTVRCLD
jgi:hypothetical protein